MWHKGTGRMSKISTSAGRAQRETIRQGPSIFGARRIFSTNKTEVCRCSIALISLIVMPFVSGAQGSQTSLSESGGESTLKLHAGFYAIGIFNDQGDEQNFAVMIRLAYETGSQP
jgi:hypothetical protein